MSLSLEEKKRFLKALRDDEEFRHAVAGVIGYREVLERLAEHDKKFGQLDEKLTRVETTLERLALTLEEGREVVSWLLKRRGIQVELRSLRIDETEYDIYGETEELIVIGEVKTRLSARRVREFDGRVRKLLKVRPSMGEKGLIKVIYTMVVQPPALEEARERGILIATAKGFVEETALGSS